MPTTIVSAIKGTVIRVMTLNTCGVQTTGAGSSQVVEAGFISVKPAPQYEDGTEFLQKTANGLLCVNQKDPGQLKRVTLDTLWCVLNPDAIVVMTGSRLITTGGVTGSGVIFNDALIGVHFSLEVWQQVTGRNACTANGAPQYVYWAFPHLNNAMVDDFTIENSNLQWGMKAETLGAGVPWGAFPTVNPPSTYLTGSSFVAGDHYAYNVVATAPPAATNGAVTVT
jgi:hypothetical protein